MSQKVSRWWVLLLFFFLLLFIYVRSCLTHNCVYPIVNAIISHPIPPPHSSPLCVQIHQPVTKTNPPTDINSLEELLKNCQTELQERPDGDLHRGFSYFYHCFIILMMMFVCVCDYFLDIHSFFLSSFSSLFLFLQ